VRTNIGLIAGLVVSVLLAAVFAVLWYGVQEDNKLLTRQVNYLTHQLEGNLSLLQKTSQQLAETQKQLHDTQKQLQDAQKQLRDAQSRLAETQRQLQDAQNQLEQTQKQLRDAQAQLSQARSQLALLETQKNQLVNQLTQLNATYQQLKKKVYAGYDLVQQAKALLSNIATFPTAIFLLQVKDEWTFMRTHTYMYNHLPSGYFYHHDLYLYKHQIVMVSTSEPLYIAFFTPDQYEKWRMGRGGTPLWSDYGRIMFMPPRDGTYVLVIHNNLARDVGNFKITYQYFKTWRYYDSVSPNLASPYIVGTPGTPSRDFFRLFAIYSYWLENRQQLANEVMHQLRTSVSSTQLQLDTRTLYALSLAALLKNTGFDVFFAAIGTSWDNPFDANSFVPVVRFRSSRNPNATFYDMFNKLSGDINWMHVMTLSKSSYDGYDFYVIIDTYNVVETVDRQLSATTPFNVIYVDGVTEPP
jgi:flagellar hook-basal body complex protein FliE